MLDDGAQGIELWRPAKIATRGGGISHQAGRIAPTDL